MQTYKCLIWDFDGVICNSLNVAIQVHNLIAKTELSVIKEVKDRESYTKELSSIITQLDQEHLFQYYLAHRNHMFERRFKLSLFEDVIIFIQKCKIPSVILTATYEKLVVDVLSNNNINSQLFSEIIGRETNGTKLTKIEEFLSRHHLKASEVLAIGDSPTDMEFCKNTGIPFIAVGYGYYSPADFDKKYTLNICNTPHSLAKCLEFCCKKV